MKSKDLKSLCETIATTVEATQPKQLAEGYINSLTEKARQVYSSINEEKDEDEDEKEESPAEEKAEDKAEMLMKKLAAKALKRAKKKAATNEEVELAEKAAPGYEDWASDPKVKASFKKQYGKDWKQVMYGRSWNMKKMDEETLDEEWGGGFQSPQDAHREVQAGLRRDASIQRRKLVADIKAVHSGKMTPAAFTRKHKTKFSELPLAKKMAASRAKAKARYLAKKAAKASAPSITEGMQLDEAGYKRLMRLKKAAYEAGQKGSPSHGRKMRAAAEQTAKVAAGMARRGGASPDAVRGGGSRIGKSGKYTQKAGALANQRDKALQSFRMKVRTAELFGRETDKGAKRERQQAQAAFEKKARTGDFGQDNQAALRARSNFQKKYGRLKGK